jgi:dTDP-4-dehydrorhamnose 3,5-epimerase
MGSEIAKGVFFIPLMPISTTGGSVMHVIKELDEHYPSFGEAYFSTAKRNSPKAWKKHQRMVCNLFVPSGAVKFVFYDETENGVVEFELSETNYGRLVIHPGIWFGFSGIGAKEESVILNMATIKHDPTESIRLEPGDKSIPYQWSFSEA